MLQVPTYIVHCTCTCNFVGVSFFMQELGGKTAKRPCVLETPLRTSSDPLKTFRVGKSSGIHFDNQQSHFHVQCTMYCHLQQVHVHIHVHVMGSRPTILLSLYLMELPLVTSFDSDVSLIGLKLYLICVLA